MNSLDVVVIVIFCVHINVHIFTIHLMYSKDSTIIDVLWCQNIVDGLLAKPNLAIPFQVCIAGGLDAIPLL